MSEENTENNEKPGFVAFCTECKTVKSDESTLRDVHLQAGHTGVCGLCGGVTKVTREDQLERAKKQSDTGRGIA